MRRFVGAAAALCLVITAATGCSQAPPQVEVPAWEADNPVVPLPDSPLGIDSKLSDLPQPPTPERVRLGRWLFFDARLSGDGTVACSTCHDPRTAFSETEPVATGIRGQKGSRKSPSFVNGDFAMQPNFFWDGRANSLEVQALGPIANPIEMGNSHEAMVQTLKQIAAYRKYFKEAFGDEQVTKERVARAIADFERTCMSGNSAWDRWRKHKDEAAVSADVKKGHDLFFGKAGCAGCHLGENFTDSGFHNLGIGWDPAARKFKDEGRYAVTKNEADLGAFKTPTLRDVAMHPPFMHDGSTGTLHEVVDHYNDGGDRNPHLDAKVKPLKLKDDEVEALVKLMEALTGENPPQTAPKSFPR
jgi:cytochrome c peroxidase